MSDVAALIAALRKKRSSWVALDESSGKRVQIRRPAETERRSMTKEIDGENRFVVDTSDVIKYTTDWEGFTEEDVLGKGVGSSDPLPFHPDLWAELVADSADWSGKVSLAILQAVIDRMKEKEDAAKNSNPS